MTKLAAPMTRVVAIHASVTRGRSGAWRRERARPPPRIERRQVRARPQWEPGRALLEEGGDAFARVGGAAGPEHRLRVEAVCVHRQGQRDAEADRGPVDRCDHRLLHVEDPERHGAAAVAMLLRRGGAAPRHRVERGAAGAEVGARAERAPRARDDHRPDAVIVVGAVPRLVELSQHRGRHRVEPVRAVQRDRADAVGDLVADLAEGHRQCVISNSTRPAASGSADGLASPGTSRAAGIPSRFVSASRTAASRRVSSSVTRTWGSGSRWRSTASCSSADLGGATPGTCSLNVAATAALKLGSPRSSWARWIFSVSSWTLRLSPSCGAATEVSASLIIGARRRKSATWVRCCSISPATSALPAAKVTGSTWRSSTVSPLPLKSRPIPLKGALSTLTSAFRTATQTASPRPACSWLSSPESGTLTLMALSESVMSAMIMPSGSPIFFFTSSPSRDGATVRFFTSISFSAVSWFFSTLTWTLTASRPVFMNQAIAASAYGFTPVSSKSRSSPLRSA